MKLVAGRPTERLTDQQTYRQTDRPTDRPTDQLRDRTTGIVTYRAAIAAKNFKSTIHERPINEHSVQLMFGLEEP